MKKVKITIEGPPGMEKQTVASLIVQALGNAGVGAVMMPGTDGPFDFVESISAENLARLPGGQVQARIHVKQAPKASLCIQQTCFADGTCAMGWPNKNECPKMQIAQARDNAKTQEERLMWCYAIAIGSDSIKGLDVCSNFKEWAAMPANSKVPV